ncbi:MAG: SDR family oxidoreductase [Chitinophagaceae bacterium]|nr:MAG: SDR family oxidoreductase [Chitinophagaceae bacterium]
MINNDGKVAVIFGVRNDSSISYNIALKLHLSGCRIFLSFVKETKQDVLYLLQQMGLSEEYAFEVDVTREDQITDFLGHIHRTAGSIDYILHGVAFGSRSVLCTNATSGDESNSSYLDIPFQDLMDSFNISAYSLLRIARVAAPLLNTGASILTLTYNASQRVIPGYAGMAINKAALENIMLYLASYFREKGVRVNALSPGLVMTTSAGGMPGIRKIRKIGKMTAPLGNVDADDVGNAALYYFSDLSKKITGNIHYVDGGFNIMGVNYHE